MDWVIFLGLAFTELAWIGTIMRIVVRKRLDLVDWFVAAMGGFNGVGYAFVVWASNSGLNPKWDQWILPYNDYYWLPPILSLIAISSVWMGAAIAGGSKEESLKLADLTPRALAGIKWLAWGFLFFSFFCYYLYAKPYGGFVELLNYSEMIRSGRFDLIGIDNPLSFMSAFGSLAFFSSFLFYSFILKGHKNLLSFFICLLGFLSSLSFSLYVLYSWLGRVSIVMYISAFPLAYIYYRNRNIYAIIIKISMLVLAIFIALPILSLYVTPGKSSTDIIEFYAREFSFPTISLFSAITNDNFRFFSDLVVAPLYILPTRIWSGELGLVTASSINTEMILGYPKGEGGVTATVPTDMITFGYMQMGTIGVAIMGLLIGSGLMLLEGLLLRISFKGLYPVLYAYCALTISTLIVLYADPQQIIYQNFHFIIGTVTLLALLQKKRVV